MSVQNACCTERINDCETNARTKEKDDSIFKYKSTHIYAWVSI